MVLHVIPSQLARGAQREARAVADHLDRPGVRADRLLSLFGGSSAVAVDWSLDHPGGTTPGVGLDPRLVLRLRSRLIELDPAVVVAHGSEPLKYLWPAMIGRRRPLVYNAIGIYSGSDRPVQQRIWRFLLARPDLVVAVGEEVRSECIERFGVPEHRVVFVPNGRDTDVFRPGPERLRSSLPRLIFVGALVDGKRPHRFIDAVSRLRGGHVPFSAAMIGDGPLRQDLARPAGDAQVELLGGRSDVPDLLEAGGCPGVHQPSARGGHARGPDRSRTVRSSGGRHRRARRPHNRQGPRDRFHRRRGRHGEFGGLHRKTAR